MSTIQNLDRKPLIDLLIAAQILLNVKDTPVNPFVKKLGGKSSSEALEEAFDILRICVSNAEPFFGEAAAVLEAERVKEMEEIDTEEQTFRDSR